MTALRLGYVSRCPQLLHGVSAPKGRDERERSPAVGHLEDLRRAQQGAARCSRAGVARGPRSSSCATCSTSRRACRCSLLADPSRSADEPVLPLPPLRSTHQARRGRLPLLRRGEARGAFAPRGSLDPGAVACVRLGPHGPRVHERRAGAASAVAGRDDGERGGRAGCGRHRRGRGRRPGRGDHRRTPLPTPRSDPCHAADRCSRRRMAASRASTPGLFDGGPWDGATCDRATQYCFRQGGIGYSPDGCRSFDCGPNSPSDAGCGPIEWDAAACGGGVRRCSCLFTSVPSVRSCSDDEAGGVVLSCGQCYGAPPARRCGDASVSARARFGPRE